MIFIYFIIALLSPQLISNDSSAQELFAVWNVGQGQWVTIIKKASCSHLDSGGERWPIKELNKLCADKENKIFITHSDWDHMNGLKYFLLHKNIKACLVLPPETSRLSVTKQNIYKQMSLCPENSPETTVIEPTSRPTNSTKNKRISANDLSRVLIHRQYLVPGDSTVKAEKFWIQKLKKDSVHQITTLILGHHGSKTSTSDELLFTLYNLKMAVASAREKKYHHPHPQIIKKIKAHHVGLLKTEDWGHLIFVN